ncbi:MAG: leucine--tRNA ligase [Actinomyces sp.]|jgi:leucyl-tRNA synthetase|nr:leucine--tRNA ligase [Actinomyces sp.]MCI1642245.1 leucine--tRNA ligase [Actinomyces sp.]MCI1662570.1 leucine--tRNA ligase [Actinomyces sp.]MCI1690947.1 leucine--tRNA ligase [Actinomyces sp.]MCI1788290.1 leucine--tRNA ligase [Actinomyces sp.]MCI1867276.1 leucine--tRNA ligase [Actinomyces sp.]
MTIADDAEPAHRYSARVAGEIESKWQGLWEERETFRADNPVGDLSGPLAELPPFFVMDMFPYPSGKGLHVGHPLGYIATDTVARYHRMRRQNVLYTMGFDAFGLPAEQYAIATGQHPAITTEQNIANMRRQLARLGLSHDTRRSFATTDPAYMRWTQWIFLQIFNSWYDETAPNREGTLGRARPIAELEAEFASGTRPTPDGRAWADLSPTERASLIDGHRLAYISEAPVNWAPGLGTVLANEEVTADGRSERGDFPVFHTTMRQWMMRITAYADRLVDGLDGVDWPEKVRSMQRHWIGRSHGATVRFAVPGVSFAGHEDAPGVADPQASATLEVFTTRPDTLFGATFMVVAPEHPILGSAGALSVPDAWPEGTRAAWTGGFATPAQAVAGYRAAAAAKSEEERTAEAGEKTGVFTGLFGVNPVTGSRVPVFVADYVLMGYGTGAIMAVPAHDDRDFAFARTFDLDIITTITPPAGFDSDAAAWTGDGVLVNSARPDGDLDLNGLGKGAAIAAMTRWLEERGLGRATTTYRLRDWLFSRQRYWGEPFPVVYGEDGRVHALPEDMLPITLPEVDDFSPRTFDPEDSDSTPETPLSRATEWLTVDLDLGEGLQTYRRDTNTMPNWAGSCSYEIRYTDPDNAERLADPANESYWMGPRTPGASGGTDLYVGGVEHAVLHLLYSRFWQKVLFDLGHVSASEPFHKLFNQGYIQAYAYRDARGAYVPAEEVEGDARTGFTWHGEPVTQEYGKMGKSLKNIVTPDDFADQYGADTLRVYEMSMGPLDISRPWDTRAAVGSQRFLQRLWRNVLDEETGRVTVTDEPADLATRRLLARTIADVTVEYEHMRINTAIAKLIVLNNHLTGLSAVPREAIEPLVLMVSPVAPHIAEELWSRLGHGDSLAREPFPVADESLLVEETVTAIVQVGGKVRARLEVAPSIGEEELRGLALATDPVRRILDGRDPLKVIVRAPRLVNVVPPQA